MEKECTCPKVKCERHGSCEECRAHHAKKGKLPYCERPTREERRARRGR